MPTPVQHAEALLGAIETLKHLEETGQAPTEAEAHALRAFPGAGCVALDLFPDPTTHQYKSPAWEHRGLALRALCTDEEYDSLLRSTYSAYYTSPLVMSAAFAILKHLGVPDTARVLEPGCGVGNFLAYAPEGMRVVGIELDRLSARIATQLWPAQDIRQGDLTGCRLPEGVLDAAIGNVPFADVAYEYKGERLSLHEVCLARALDSLKPGGVAVLVMTHSFLDRERSRFRQYVCGQADLLGAIRLPSTAFEAQGTSVVADLVVFQKHQQARILPFGWHQGMAPEWTRSLPMDIDGVAVPVNAYFHSNPAMVLGTWSLKDRLYGSSYSVEPPADLPSALAQAITTLPSSVFPAPVVVETEEAEEDVSELRPLPEGASQLTEAALYLDSDGTICQRAGAGGVAVIYSGKTLSPSSGVVGQRVAALIRLKEQAREVLRRQSAGAVPGEKQAARSLLTMMHALFTKQHGAINKTTVSATKDGSLTRRQPNVARFKDDPDAMLVMALEHYDEEQDSAERAAIFHRDVVGAPEPTVAVDSAEAALLQSLDQTGGVDVPLMADLYGKPQAEILAELAELVYLDPETQQWETADQYLSGNVRAKLQAAHLAGEAYARNVQALEAVQPPDLLPSDIEGNLGAPWIPPSDIEVFVRELCEAREYWPLAVHYVPSEAVWAVNAGWQFESSIAMGSTYGTRRVNGMVLLEQALNMRVPNVYDTVGEGDHTRQVLNGAETLAAGEKQQALKEAFRQWLWVSPQRAERLVRAYNDLYNNIRLRAFAGPHLAFPGMSAEWQDKVKPAQKDAVWRILSGGNTLLAHCVGAGKTAVMVAAGMKLRQTGRIRKPLYVVPNHMLEQFIREALQLYPNARMLLASSEDMSKRKRKLLAARIATAEWDGIITTHSAFERMGMSPAYQARFLRELIQQYEEVLTSDTLPDEAHADRGVRNIRKRLEKTKARYEEKLETLLAAEKKDDSLTFDELGIDYLFIDESQHYKNLETPSKLGNVAGIQTKGSQRSFDMALKLRYLQEQHPGQCVTMASGTPISNTMVEMYTIMRYLDPDGLAARGLGHFDAWAATFGDVVESMEIAPDGHSMRPRQRFARFINLSELQMQFRTFADVATKEQLMLPVPPIIGGKAQVIACPMSPTQRELQIDLVERYEAIRNGDVKPWEDNALAVTTDGRKLALDARMLTADAVHEPGGKIQACADQVLALYHATRERRATQLVFCDLGVKPTAWGFSGYGQLIDCLVKGGMPEAEIACIHEASSDADKYALQVQMREGKVAVLIGSTAKMGTGLNVQQRLLALHHLDAPWKPAEVEQREGRIVRQGNMHETSGVYLYTYVTEGSFDAYMWQALQTKAGFIGQVMHGSLTTREVKDIDEQTLTYAEVKAIATGNPAMLVLARTEAECRRLGLLRKHHADAQYRAQQQLGWLPGEITKYETRLAGLRADLALLAQSTPADPWHLDASVPMLAQQTLETEETVTPPDDPALRLTLWAQTLRQTMVTQDFPVGTWRGLTITVRLHSMALPQVLIRGQVQYESPLDKRAGFGRSLVRAVGHLVEMYPAYERGLMTEIEKLERSRTRYGASLGHAWPQEAYAKQLDTLRRELKTALTDTRPEERPEGFREAALVAADIEALQASQHVDTHAPGAGPARMLSVAAPITAQIQARLDGRAQAEAGA